MLSGSTYSAFERSSWSLPFSPSRQPSEKRLYSRARNVVVFGESGVGKSSVINMIVGRIVTKTSNDAVGCTFRHQCHEVVINGVKVNLWDTAGLDEGTEGTVPAAQAEEGLKAFLRQVTRSDGIDLLVYCVRGSRVRKALLRNYNIFYAAICRKKVPVALVVTGLENYEGEMDLWWAEHEKDLRKHGMQFDAHACVTTIPSDHPAIQNRRGYSQSILRELILKRFEIASWRANEDSLITASLSDVRALMSSLWTGEKRVAPVIMICDTTEQDPRARLAPGINPSWEKCTGSIKGREYKYIHTHEQPTPGKDQQLHERKRRFDLLLFYAAADWDRHSIWSSLECFYASYGGETCPLIVVFKGLDNQAAAAALWKNLSFPHGGNIIAHPTFFPGPGCSSESLERAEEALNELIESKCLMTFEEKSTKSQKVYRYSKPWTLFARRSQS
ncbi:hypothetical protein HYDPIDRAFT_108441 [Hydnomerulius pinastri MD-312]|nr:hypothetical protein HYDPIDRAFT_108441 [Hydnomerulius pinastri MD-312]